MAAQGLIRDGDCVDIKKTSGYKSLFLGGVSQQMLVSALLELPQNNPHFPKLLWAMTMRMITAQRSPKAVLDLIQMSGNNEPIYGNTPTPPKREYKFGEYLFKNREIRFFAERYQESPYRGKVYFLARTLTFDAPTSAGEYFVLEVAPNGGGIPVTGWSVFNYTRKEAFHFPKAIDVFLPFVKVREDTIFTRPNDRLIVTTGSSPIGVSFRVNKCLGYKEQFKKFTPTLKTECPSPRSELLNDLTVSFTEDTCYDFVDTIDRCESATKIPTKITGECATFIRNTFTEEGCVKLHRNDDDFLYNEVRLFLGERGTVWRSKSDALFLLDQNGKLVDVLEY